MTNRDFTILVVDDDPGVAQALTLLLRQAGYGVESCNSGEEALSIVERMNIDLVLADVRMPGIGGVELLRRVVELRPDLPVVMITAHGKVDVAVDAMKLGASDFMTKPFDREEILFVIDKALQKGRDEERPPAPPRGRPSDFVGESPAMQEVFDLIERAAMTRSTVLIRGETGTGKALVARAAHDQGPNSSAPFVTVHCAGLPESLLESELFGHEKGAFTGAARRKPGRIELASGGTVFLDEIGDVSLSTQIKLLRVLSDREFERVGGTRPLKADVRFISATHRDLEAMIESGEFREDFFYRLNVIPIWVPPLRERPGDIRRLADHFCGLYASTNGRDVSIAEDGYQRLEEERWPGNVRELQNVMERLVVLSDTDTIGAREVEKGLGLSTQRPVPAESSRSSAERPDATQTLEERRREAERDLILDTLDRTDGNRSKTARILDISRRTLYNKLEEYGLE